MPVKPGATKGGDSSKTTGISDFSNVRAPLPDERTGSAGLAPQGFYEEGKHAGQVAADSTRVGFTVRNSSNRIVDAFAFRMNPQGIGYTLGARASMAAVKSGLYVDDFGPSASVIVLRQLVVNGKNAYLDGAYYTGREDVQRFLKTVFLPATSGQGKVRRRVFFHDHHFERGFEQRVFFGPSSLQIERSVEQPGIWRVELQMVSLEKYPYTEIEAEKTPTLAGSGKQYRVKRGDTLDKIVRKIAGKGANSLKRQFVTLRLLELNPQLRKKRTVPGGATGKPMRVYPGELLALP